MTELRIDPSSKRSKAKLPILFRRGYDSGKVYNATLDPVRDTGVLPLNPKTGTNFIDPFAESRQVKTDYWHWQLIERRGAHSSGVKRTQPGRLVGWLLTSRQAQAKWSVHHPKANSKISHIIQ